MTAKEKFDEWWDAHPAERLAFQTRGDAEMVFNAGWDALYRQTALILNPRFIAACASLTGLRALGSVEHCVAARAVRDADALLAELAKDIENPKAGVPGDGDDHAIRVRQVRDRVLDLIRVSNMGRTRDELWRALGSHVPKADEADGLDALGRALDEALLALQEEDVIKIKPGGQVIRWVPFHPLPEAAPDPSM